MKKLITILTILLLMPFVYAYDIYDICGLYSDSATCKTLVSTQSTVTERYIDYEFYQAYPTATCSGYGDNEVKKKAENLCSLYSSSKTYTIKQCDNGGNIYAQRTVCLYDSNTNSYTLGDGKCDTSLGEPITAKDCTDNRGGSFSDVRASESVLKPLSYIHITGKFTAIGDGIYLIENIPTTCAGEKCSFSLLQTAAFISEFSACEDDKYSAYYAGYEGYLDKGETADIDFWVKVPSKEGDYVYKLGAYYGCSQGLISSSSDVKFRVSNSGTTSTVDVVETETVQTEMSGKFSDINIPDEGIAGEKLIATATFTAKEKGEYLLELEPDTSVIGVAGFQTVVSAEESACDGNKHWASKSVVLNAGDSIDLAFSPTLASKEGVYQYRFNVWSGCSDQGGTQLESPSDWESVTVYSPDIEQATEDGYKAECTDSTDCGIDEFCLNSYCLSNKVTEICDTGSVCGTDNEEVEEEDNTYLLLGIAGIVLLIAVLLIIYFATRKRRKR